MTGSCVEVMYTGMLCVQEETLLIEIEDHRQPLCIRFLSQLINKVGSDSYDGTMDETYVI